MSDAALSCNNLKSVQLSNLRSFKTAEWETLKRLKSICMPVLWTVDPFQRDTCNTPLVISVTRLRASTSIKEVLLQVLLVLQVSQDEHLTLPDV